jgi:tRNA 2-thiouridine synthesizing protein A
VNEDPVDDVALELDCRGMRCPRPIIELARHVGDVAVGEVVGVASTDAAARADVPAWCRMRGHDYVGEAAAEDGTPLFLVRRLA